MIKRKPKERQDMRLLEIREMLLLKQWTRDELADKLGVSRNLIDRWFCTEEKQRRRPSNNHISKMRVWLREARDESRSLTA